jgi:nucleotide-binding universal stress UspA family protein
VLEVEARISLEAPDDALVMAARDGYDLVVVGHRGQGVLRELVLGSTAKSVVDRAPCSVLVVR